MRRGVEVRRERGERFELAVLREVEAQTAGDRAHRLHLRRATDAGHRDTDVDRGTNAGEEQVGLEEDLAVGDRDDVRRDVGRHVAGLRLDDRQRGERAAGLEDRLAVDDARVFAQLRRALEQARVEIEHVAGERFAARRTTQHERQLAIRGGLLGQVVVHAQRRLALVDT